MRRLVPLVLAAVVILVAIRAISGSDRPPAPTSAPTPFGVMLARTDPALAHELGVSWVRVRVVLDAWTGGCRPCDVYREAGFGLILTVRTNGTTGPSSPPADLGAYADALAEVLDSVRPAVLVVENEPEVPRFYSGSSDDYLRQLTVACGVARDQGVLCADGGVSGQTVIALTYAHLWANAGPASAQEFAAATAPDVRPPLARAMASGLTGALRARAERALELLTAYRTAGSNLLNLHWYGRNAEALAQSASYLRAASGLPLMSNEMGQRIGDSVATTALMKEALRLKLRYIVWFSIDRSPGAGRDVVALTNPDGSFRETGRAFRQVIAEMNRGQAAAAGRRTEPRLGAGGSTFAAGTSGRVVGRAERNGWQ